MTFRIKSFSVEGENIKTPLVELSKEEIVTNGNYFTVIIGNNGTGKTRFISNLVEFFKNLSERRVKAKFDYTLKYCIDDFDFYVEGRTGIVEKNIRYRKIKKPTCNKDMQYKDDLVIPNKVIALTTSISDKFPSDNYHYIRGVRSSRERERETKKDLYTYLGHKFFNRISSRALIDRAISTFIINIGDYAHNKSYRHIFDYLDYEPVLKLAYKIIRPRYIDEFPKFLTGSNLKKYLYACSVRRGGFRGEMIQKELEEKDDSYWDEIADIYNYMCQESKRKEEGVEFSFMVNFSSENEARERDLLGSEQARFYLYLEELRRLELVRGPNIKMYKKKSGGEFDFSDASSGEASILSTLIALIPNIKNNSLIVIDEPEISLHPSWQSRYIELIDRILDNKTGCHIVIATHSHFIISDLPLERSHVVHFKDEKHHSITIDYIEKETYGLSAEDILLNVFGMPSTRNYYLSKEVSEALELVAEGQMNSERFNYLQSKLKRYYPNLKKVDPLRDIIETLLSLGNK
ncbi:AAA family ATPase [Xenorhabdus bovienii]|uniref:AAA family ATPase n=1 Tax=Xenorhabdus bovienii TaxID=40576 RepID=UPI0023B2AE63|nr:AAA family ATPase [Xenorhabdus bovienii]MDE9455412.1 ATP-binding protein [Xenorhabdus bovienii]